MELLVAAQPRIDLKSKNICCIVVRYILSRLLIVIVWILVLAVTRDGRCSSLGPVALGVGVRNVTNHESMRVPSPGVFTSD